VADTAVKLTEITFLYLVFGLGNAVACTCAGHSLFSEQLPNRVDLTVAVFTAKVLRFEAAPVANLPDSRQVTGPRPGGRTESNRDAGRVTAPIQEPQERRLVFQVLEAFSGPVKGNMEAFTPQQGSACGLEFAEGETYLVEARLWLPQKPRWVVNLCSRTLPLQDARAAENLKTLQL